jgi:hypothetical protein
LFFRSTQERVQERYAVIAQHVEKYVGKISFILQNKEPHLLPIDILVVEPSEEKNYYTLITCGMSEYTQNIPSQVGPIMAFFSELTLCLPANWSFTTESLKNINFSWPLTHLSKIARYPHEHHTLLWLGHTVQEEQPESFPNTNFTSWAVDFPHLIGKEHTLIHWQEKTIVLLGIYPLYESELQFTLSKGFDALSRYIEKTHITECINVYRKRMTPPLFWLSIKEYFRIEPQNWLWRFYMLLLFFAYLALKSFFSSSNATILPLLKETKPSTPVLHWLEDIKELKPGLIDTYRIEPNFVFRR